MKRRYKIIILVFIISIGVVVFLRSQNIGESSDDDKVIEGGIIGGPINIGSGRISVTSDAENETVVFGEEGIDKDEIRVLEGSMVSFKNEDNVEHSIGFFGEQKSAVVKPDYNYVVTFTSKGEYKYFIEYNNSRKEGVVIVE